MLHMLQQNHTLALFPLILSWTMLNVMGVRTHYLIVLMHLLKTVAQLKVQGLSARTLQQTSPLNFVVDPTQMKATSLSITNQFVMTIGT